MIPERAYDKLRKVWRKKHIDLIMEIISVAEYDNSAVTETARSYRA